MRNLVVTAILLAAIPPGAAASAQPAAGVEMTCPIGGEKFQYGRAASVASFGMRPDGKPYGGGTFPAALPECPSNGLVLYKDYGAAEVEKLTPLVASDAYQAGRETDTPYYRAYTLMRELGEAPDDYLWALLQASWQADGKPELRARYLAELAEAAAAVPTRPADIQWIGMEGRAINALRELGRFDEAAARLAKLSLSALEEPLAASLEEPAATRNRRGWLTYFKALKAAVARRDASAEPFDMIPRTVAIARCLDEADKLDAGQRLFCEADQAKADVEALRTSRTASQAEIDALRRPRDEAGR